MKIRFSKLEGNDPEVLLAALVSGLRRDGVRIIFRNYIRTWLDKYEKAGAAFLIHYSSERIPAKSMRILCVNHGDLDKSDFDLIKTFEKLYNSIDEWGFE